MRGERTSSFITLEMIMCTGYIGCTLLASISQRLIIFLLFPAKAAVTDKRFQSGVMPCAKCAGKKNPAADGSERRLPSPPAPSD